MLTSYLDNLQYASATAQIATCLLGSVSVFVVCFAPGAIADHVRAYRAAR